MAIRIDEPIVDAQGLPVVTWEEDRNLFAPDGFGPARVVCFLRPDETGVLQFVSVGSVRHGPFEKARSWERLVSFARETAERLYCKPSDRVLIEVLAGKSKTGIVRWPATDGAQIMLANFADHNSSVPMHLNCADCEPVEMALLHDRLHREFIAMRTDLVLEHCDGEYVWPKNKHFTPYEPPARPHVPAWVDRSINLSIIAMLGAVGWWLYWMFIK